MDDPLIGQHLGNYRIDSVIGRGGMAIVYYGWDENLHRPVAVKVIDARYRDNPAYAERFLQEARSVATWRHDNILQVFYAGQEGDVYFFAMEFVDGPDLSKVMHQYSADGELMPHEDVLKISRAVADALDYAHQQKIIHRDVKPSNVMVAKDGRIALADFGLALNAQQGSFGGTFGTPHYIAPEQARNSAMAVPQSDLYSLAVILYEMLTGSVPFDDPSPTSLAVQHLTQPPPPPRQLNPNLSQAAEKVLLKALHKQPEGRYETGAALIIALAEALQTTEAGSEAVVLPPLPSGAAVAPAMSQMSLADRVSLYMPPPPPSVQPASSFTPASSSDFRRGGAARMTPPSVPVPAPTPTPTPTPATTERKGFPLAWIGGGILVVLLLFVVMTILGGGDDTESDTVVAAPLPTETETAVRQEETVPTEAALLPEETEPAPTQTTTSAVPDTEVLPVATVAPTETAAVPAPSATAVPPTSEPAAPLPTDTPLPAPTATPSGMRLVMFYDDYSFYLYNPNPDRVRVSQLVFESLDENGNPNGYWFEGQRWAQFYSFVEEHGCDRLETTKAPGWLRPSQCREYNSTVTPEQDGDIVFWTARPGVVQFRVLWQGQEVGRCDVTGERCEVYLPE